MLSNIDTFLQLTDDEYWWNPRNSLTYQSQTETARSSNSGISYEFVFPGIVFNLKQISSARQSKSKNRILFILAKGHK